MKRFALVDEAMEEDSHGGWVPFSDVEVLLAELNLLRSEAAQRPEVATTTWAEEKCEQCGKTTMLVAKRLEDKPVAWIVHAEYPFVTMDPPMEGGLPRTPLYKHQPEPQPLSTLEKP
jgi:hypothetical protein